MMIQFGTYYLQGKLVVYDVCLEQRQGRQLYIASLSEDPRICFAANRPESAVDQLQAYLATAAMAPITWLPGVHQNRTAV